MTREEELHRLLAEATQIPWRLGEMRTYGIYGSGQEDALATVRHWDTSLAPRDPEDDANAALIVAAVNTLPSLLDVAEKAKACRQKVDMRDSDWHETAHRVFQELDDALARLEALS